MSRTAEELLAATRRLVDIPSVSLAESAIAADVEAALDEVRHLEVTRVGNNVVARTALGRTSRVVLAGHLDTVPPADNARAELEGRRLTGVGSADMKGGLAVMLALAEDLDAPTMDCTFVFYAREEIARRHSGLRELEATRPQLLAGDAAIVLEPTNGIIEAGCQGVVRLVITVGGERAHSARPWVGSNAIHRLGSVLRRIAEFDERQPEIDGVTYHETLQAVGVEGGVAGNVIPDRARLTVSHRFAPDRDVEEATWRITEFFAEVVDLGRGDSIVVEDAAPAAAPNLDHPVLAALAEASGAAPAAKTAWTDVAFFAERGVPAANFGPGDPLVAHTAGEFVDGAEIARVAAVLERLLA